MKYRTYTYEYVNVILACLTVFFIAIFFTAMCLEFFDFLTS